MYVRTLFMLQPLTPVQSWVLNVTNPSCHPLMIQPILLQHYTNSESIVDLISEHIDPNLDFSISQTSSFSFLRDDALFETELSMSDTVIQPDEPYPITVAFSPKVDATAGSLLLIRNNLTVLDYVVLKGRGIQGVFSIDGIQPAASRHSATQLAIWQKPAPKLEQNVRFQAA